MATVTQSSKLGNVVWPTVAWVIALLFFFPIFWLVFTSFKTDADAVKPRVTSTATAEDADTNDAHRGFEWARTLGVAAGSQLPDALVRTTPVGPSIDQSWPSRVEGTEGLAVI